MAQAKEGDTVRVHYTGTLEDGSVFDSSEGRGPLEFEIGQSYLIPGFQEAIVGMDEGETKIAHIPAEQAYGPRDEELVVVMDRDKLQDDLKLKVNDRLKVRRTSGKVIDVKVTEVSESSVIMDGNHPLAGEELTFEIHLIEIV